MTLLTSLSRNDSVMVANDLVQMWDILAKLEPDCVVSLNFLTNCTAFWGSQYKPFFKIYSDTAYQNI